MDVGVELISSNAVFLDGYQDAVDADGVDES